MKLSVQLVLVTIYSPGPTWEQFVTAIFLQFQMTEGNGCFFLICYSCSVLSSITLLLRGNFVVHLCLWMLQHPVVYINSRMWGARCVQM